MTFDWPLGLLSLALVPVLLGIYLWMQRRRRAYALRFTNLDLLQSVVGRGPGVRRHVPPALFLLGLAAVLVALARPSLVMAVPSQQSSVMLVLDVSGSMAATDLQPTRMGAATQAARSLIEALPDGAQVGVVSFSQNATVVAPLSPDTRRADAAVQRLRANGGTAVGEGLSAALDQLEQRPIDADGNRPAAVVVLLSDGESNSGRAAADVAERARQDGVQVNTVGIGQRGGATLIDRQRVGLDEATLQQVARTTGGQYFYAADSSELNDVYASLGSQMSWIDQRTEVTALASGLGALFLILGGLFALRWFGRLP